jgi:hypothetical protein
LPAAQVLFSGTVPAADVGSSSGAGALPAAQVLSQSGTEPASMKSCGVMSEAATSRSTGLAGLAASMNQVVRNALPVSQHAVALSSNRLAQLISSGRLGRGSPAGKPRADEPGVAVAFHAGGSSAAAGPQLAIL